MTAASRRLRPFLALACAAALSACAETASMPPIAAARPSAPILLAEADPPYRVQIGDDLAVKFLNAPELNEDVVVRPDGRISTAVASEVRVVGLTVPQATAALKEQYKSELREPKLNLIVKAIAPLRFYVAGEVASPGEYTTSGATLTLSQAIARAGGVRVGGSPDHTFVIRRGAEDRPTFFATRLADVLSGTDATADVRLQPYDVVFVPRTGIAQAYLLWNQYVQQFVPVSWGFSYLLNQPTNVSSTNGALAAPR